MDVLSRAMPGWATAEWPVIALFGDIDIDTFARHRALVARMIRPATTGVVLDLARVEFFGSAGVHLLLWLIGEDLRVRLVNVPPMAQRVIEVVALDDHPLIAFE